MAAVDPAFWTVRRVFGVAGGADVHALTEAGLDRAFSVGAGVKPGLPSQAMRALSAAGGQAVLQIRVASRMHLTDLGRKFDEITWSYLRELGLVESPSPDAVRFTAAGQLAVERGQHEQDRLLQRVRQSHPLTP